MGRGHAGAICDVLSASGIDPDHWSARQITTALNADMRVTGHTWPDQITCPAAFLATRLKRIDWTPPPVNDGGCAAGPDQKQPTPATAEATSTHHPRQQAQQETDRQDRLAAQVAARTAHAHARAVARAALGGPGHTAARTALAAALTTAPPAAPGASAAAPPPPTYVPYRSINTVASYIDATERNG